MKKKLAIVGSGISGLGAAYYLRNDFDITIFDKNDYIGGHTHTHKVTGHQNVDTGFIVFNEVTYPNLCRLFSELDVASEKSNMSFSVYNMDRNLQWCGSSLSLLFAQRRNLLKPKYYRFLLEINRFNNTAVEHLESGAAELALGDYLDHHNYSSMFRENYLYPMSSAVWSTPIEKLGSFPAATLIRFFRNHGFLGLNTQYQWRYVKGGSNSYIDKILMASPTVVKLNEKVYMVEKEGGPKGGAVVRSESGSHEFDRVLIATHADEALKIRSNLDPLEAKLLPHFKYENNKAILHTDSKVMPPLKRIWSAWNYKLRTSPGNYETATVYYMNPLQRIQGNVDYFVSINEFEDVDPDKIIRSIDYTHPLFDTATDEAQKELPGLNTEGPIFYSGSYFRYGFHEDGLLSGINAAAALQASINQQASVSPAV